MSVSSETKRDILDGGLAGVQSQFDSTRGFEQLTFWHSDLHDGTRADFTSLLTTLGHRVINAGSKRKESPYPSVFEDSLVTNLDLRRLF